MAKQVTTKSGVVIDDLRWLIRRDIPDVLNIESSVFTFPWSEDDFIRALRKRNCIGMACEVGDQVVAFMLYELHKNRLHVLNFAVAKEWARKGVGAAMVDKLKSKLSVNRRNQIEIEVRETNFIACQFFKAMGFVATCIHRNYYDDVEEDAIGFRFKLGDDKPKKASINRVKAALGG